MGIAYSDRSYIQKFSKAYKILYKEDPRVYLPEIFDSAQEGYSYLWVNGEKYVFSDEVLTSGKNLKTAFGDLHKDLAMFHHQFKYNVESNQQFREIKQELNQYLEQFDHAWAEYEKNYILELMVIESDSRRYIKEAIAAEKELCKIEKSGTKEDIGEATSQLLACLCKINAVANTTGKGRDDLGVEVLEIVEKRQEEIALFYPQFSKCHLFSKICQNIYSSFNNLRLLL